MSDVNVLNKIDVESPDRVTDEVKVAGHAQSHEVRAREPNASDIALIKKFLADTTLFLGPDPEIMRNHDLMPRSGAEERAIREVNDGHTIAKIRDRIQAGADEGYEM